MSLATTPTPDPAGPKAAPDAPPLEELLKGNRNAASAAVLVLLEIVPLAGLTVALREHTGVWIVLTAVLSGAALLPALGVALGQRWGYKLGQYIIWASLVGIVLRLLHVGFSLIYIPPAMMLGVLLVALEAPKRSADSDRSEKKPESLAVWIKENIEAIIVAFIMALVIRCFCIEVFKIPSSSMEPTLLGDVSRSHTRDSCPFNYYHVPLGSDNATGDRIMVTKYYYAFSPVERFDVVVFKFPLNQAKNFIKRVVGLPNEELRIYRGNLYVRKPDGDGKFHIARRTLRTQDSIWIDPAKETNGYLARFDDFHKSWEAGPAADKAKFADAVVAEGELSTQEKEGERSVQFHFRPKSLDDSNGKEVDDVRIVFDLEITSPKGQVYAEVVNAYGRFEARLDTEGESQLRYHKPGSEKGQPTEIVPLKDVHLGMDRSMKLELSIFDGTAYVRVNDGERARLAFIETREDVRENDAPDRRITFGARGLTFKVRNLALGRDIFYRGRGLDRELVLHEDEIAKIPAHSYMMMGDNVTNSHDSRAWIRHTFHLKDGRSVVCEEQQIIRSYSSDFIKNLQEKLNLSRTPEIGIDGDEHGNEVAIFQDEIESEDKPEPFRFVDEKFIVGKALWIWWPVGRWFHLIR